MNELPWTVDARAAAIGLFYGLLPSISGGPALELGLSSPWPLRFEASGTLLLGATIEQGAQGADFFVWFAGVSACPELALPPILVSACLGGDIGQMVATGFGYDRNREARQFLPLVHGELRAEVRWGRTTLELGALLIVPLRRDEFVFVHNAARSVIFRPDPIAFGLRLGIGVGSW